MNFYTKLSFALLALASTACSNSSCPCPYESNNTAIASTEAWLVPQEAQVVQQETKVVQPEAQVIQPEVQISQKPLDIQEPQETQVVSSENPQTSLVIKRPQADLSKHLSFLLEPYENHSGSI